MARAIWSGAISFGLVNVPVKAYTAVRDHDVHFHQVDEHTGARIRHQRVSEKSGKEVAPADIKLSYELGGGQHVVLDPDELDQLRPRTTKTIEISDFVALDQIDPIYYERTYWLAPDGEAASRAYRLLTAAMEQANRVGVGAVVMRNKQYLAAIRPVDGVLAMSTMRFADEVVPHSAIDQLPSRNAKADPKELELAAQIIDSLTTEWDPKSYHDTYTDELKELIAKSAKGEAVVADGAPAAQADVIDLMEALKASLDSAKKSGAAKKSGPAKPRSGGTRAAKASSARAKKAPAAEGAAKKSPAAKGPAKKASARKSA